MDIHQKSTPADVYLIELDCNNRDTSGQSIPLHTMENKFPPELLIPIVPAKQAPLHLLVDASKKIDISDHPPHSVMNSHQVIHGMSSFSLPLQQTHDSVLVDPKTLNTITQDYTNAGVHNEISQYYTNEGDNSVKSNILPKAHNLASEVGAKSEYNLQEMLQHIQFASERIQQRIIINQLNHDPTLSLPPNKPMEISKTSKESSEVQQNEDNVLTQKRQNYIHISDTKVSPRAFAVLPSVLQIRKNEISPRKTLPARIRFGPVQGISQTITQSEAKVLVQNSQKPVFLLKDDNGSIIHIDVTDIDKSNWIGLLPLGDQKTANVWLYEENNKLYIITITPINARMTLKIGYSKKYAEDHQLPPGIPVIDLESVLSVNPKQWWCNECHRALSSASLLQRHVDVYHKDYIPNPRRGYRCRYCKRTFSTLFTVRRHTLQHCSKRALKSPDKPAEKQQISTETVNSSKYDDNRVPSDESFQNFTNGLDFSTNLFDTDRIPNLDISIGSRTDVEFNSYSMTREDNAMNNDFSRTPNNEGYQENQVSELPNMLETCGYCDAVVLKTKKRKHVSLCPARRLKCECGRSFTNKKQFSEHIDKEHIHDDPETKQKNREDDKKKYRCEQCDRSFLRRGMLANHFWKEHNAVFNLPIEKSVKHYPCVACPKIYRSASKRDAHVKVHHPGAEKVKGVSIEGGVKSVEAALCPACPRQYATRSKLLQHIRARHPTMASPKRKRTKRQDKTATATKTKCLESDGPHTETMQ